MLLFSCKKEISQPEIKNIKAFTNKKQSVKIIDTLNINKFSNPNTVYPCSDPNATIYPCEYYPPGTPCSCNPTPTNPTPIPSTPSSTTITTNATLQNGMLYFSTSNDFLSTMEQLDNADENYTGYDSYMNYYGGNLDRIDSLLDAKGIDESSTFINFENRFPGFYSMRKNIETQESMFLNNGGDPADKLNPENLNILADDVFRTLLNKDGGVKVENIIFKFFDNGVCYAILNGSTTLFNKLSHPENYNTSNAYYPEFYQSHFFNEDTVNVKLLTPYLLCTAGGEQLPSDEPVYPCLGNYVGGKLMGTDCKLWYKNKIETKYDNDKKKYVSKIGVYNTFIYNVGLSKIRSYKLKTNGKWKPIRTKLSAYTKEYGCSDYDKSKSTKFRKFRRAAKRDMGTIIPGLGQLSQGIYWFFYNFIGGFGKNNEYLRYFKTATNNGGFYGDNYCNGNRQLVQAQW